MVRRTGRARDGASVGLGIPRWGSPSVRWSSSRGLDWWWAGASSALIYGGSFEFLLIGMVAAAAPLASVAVAAFLVQARHVFYALSFPLHRVRGRLARTYSTFALTDEAYALTATCTGPHLVRPAHPVAPALPAPVLGRQRDRRSPLLGALVPDGVAGLDFALTALFAVLALDAVRDLRGDPPTPPSSPCSARWPPASSSPTSCSWPPSPCSPPASWPATSPPA